MSQLPPATPAPHNPNPGDAPVVEPGFEALIHSFWEKNRSLILLACVAALLAIVGREGWQYFSAMRERAVQEEYAKAADRPEKLAAFADSYSSHALAGVANLQLADQKFSVGDYKQAVTLYTKAVGSLKNETLLGRARLGAAISQVDGGDRTAGEAALKALGTDQTVLKSVRAEATFHLASMALEAGRMDDVRKLIDEVSKIDLGGPWSQRAMALQMSLQGGATPADAAAPAITFKP